MHCIWIHEHDLNYSWQCHCLDLHGSSRTHTHTQFTYNSHQRSIMSSIATAPTTVDYCQYQLQTWYSSIITRSIILACVRRYPKWDNSITRYPMPTHTRTPRMPWTIVVHTHTHTDHIRCECQLSHTHTQSHPNCSQPRHQSVIDCTP